MNDALNREVLVGARVISQMALPELAKHYRDTREAAFAIRGQAKSIVRMNDEARAIIREVIPVLEGAPHCSDLVDRARAFLGES